MNLSCHFIKCLAALAPTRDCRKYLNAVNVNFSKNRFEVSNGQYAVVFTLQKNEDTEALQDLGVSAGVTDSLLIPIDVLNKIVKITSVDDTVTISYQNGQWYLNDLRFTPLEGNYPNLENCSTSNGIRFLSDDTPKFEVIDDMNNLGLNLALLSVLYKGLKELSRKSETGIKPKFGNSIILSSKKGVWLTATGNSKYLQVDILLMPLLDSM